MLNNILHRPSFKAGFKDCCPLAISLSIMFFSLGMLAAFKNVSLINTILMTAFIFAIPLQTLLINNQDFSITTTIINALIINFKFIFMSTALIATWTNRNLFKICSLHFVVNSVYITCSKKKDMVAPWSYYMGIVLPVYILSIIFSALGHLFWDIGSNYQDFLKSLSRVTLPIHFICITSLQKGEKAVILASFIGFISSPLLNLYFPRYYNTIIWAALALLLVYYETQYPRKNV